MILRRLLLIPSVGLLAGFAGTGFAQTQVNVQDPVNSANKQAVDANGNAAVTAIPTASATTGGATRLCTNQIMNTATACGSAAAHQVYAYEFDNTQNALPSWFQIFDVAVGSVTVGTTTPSAEIEIPPGASEIIPISVGDSFSNQITLACTTTSTGPTAPLSNCGYTIWGK